MLADLDVQSADDRCYGTLPPVCAAGSRRDRRRTVHTQQPVFACVGRHIVCCVCIGLHRAAVWNSHQTQDAWYRPCLRSVKRCYRTVRPEAAPTQTAPVAVSGSERATCKDIRSGISAPALIRRVLRQPSHGPQGRPCATPQHQCPRWGAETPRGAETPP